MERQLSASKYRFNIIKEAPVTGGFFKLALTEG